LLILILSFSIFLIKNFSRITKNFSNNFEPWPTFKKITFYKENINDFKIHRVINGNDPQLTVCWDVSFLCLRSDLNNLKIIKNYNYIFLSIYK